MCVCVNVCVCVRVCVEVLSADLEPVRHDDDRGVCDGAQQLLGRSLLLLSVVLLLHLGGQRSHTGGHTQAQLPERKRSI